MQIPVPIQVRIQWRPDANVETADRARVAQELSTLSWELSQTEALLHDVMRVADGERAYLMPRIELRLPLYDAGRRLRIVFSNIDSPKINLVDEQGKRLADIVLL